jgi:hypothetical protein
MYSNGWRVEDVYLDQGVQEHPSSDANISIHCTAILFSVYRKHIQYWRLILDTLTLT